MVSIYMKICFSLSLPQPKILISSSQALTFLFRGCNNLTPVPYLSQQDYDTINCQRYGYNINNRLSGVAQQHVFEYKKQAKQSGFQNCKMEGINNATRGQIVINFYQNNQAKGKPYTTEYFSELNVTHHQVYRATIL